MYVLRRVALLTLLLLSWAWVGNDRAPTPLAISDAVAAPVHDQLDSDEKKAPHELSAMRIFSKVILYVEDTRDIEYAAINGMLQTLDPHSVLLKPEMYREMKLTTKGEFGGLGFVIQMKEGNLTVVKVLPKTPAFRAGIKKDDLITKIGEE